MQPFAIPAFLAAALLVGCTRTEIRQEAWPDGVHKSQSAVLIRTDNSQVKHGIQAAWYPDGGKESMEIYVNGYRQGYAFRWHPNGRIQALEHFTDGMRDGQAKFWDGEGNLVVCFTADASDCLRPASDAHDLSMLAARP